ncbi:MAG: HAD-IIIC family phosphatase [Clostridia bacterium]
MSEIFSYPFDPKLIVKNRKKLKRELSEKLSSKAKKIKIAVLGGSTTNDVVDILELFLLDMDILPTFYASEYSMYWQDAMFGNEELDVFKPDVIYIHTSERNLHKFYPSLSASFDDAQKSIDNAYNHFSSMWDVLEKKFGCTIIQNNFELPFFRILGNLDGVDVRGRVNFVNEINRRFALKQRSDNAFVINDINYISACYGIDKWSSTEYWYLYKYALTIDAIPYLAKNLSSLFGALYGKSKKAFALDLDNTLWGGVVGDDGVDGIELGEETPVGQAYLEFDRYLRAHKDMGIVLSVSSKNDYENAVAGLNHPDSVLKPDDFLVIKANWENKSENISSIAKQVNIGVDSIVFVDDNPAERLIVADTLPCCTPKMDNVSEYIRVLDKNAYFETTSLSDDDLNRNEMYKANLMREQESEHYVNYDEYLASLNMKAEIQSFSSVYIQRIAQLTNKSNQFNLTTKRYTVAEIVSAAEDNNHITLYGKLYDRFGDNGVVSVVIGNINENHELDVDLWLMSCRVLKRDMEYAMLDVLVEKCRERSINKINGYYYPTAKNSMVKFLYQQFGFDKISEDEMGNSIWSLSTLDYVNQNKAIKEFIN